MNYIVNGFKNLLMNSLIKFLEFFCLKRYISERHELHLINKNHCLMSVFACNITSYEHLINILYISSGNQWRPQWVATVFLGKFLVTPEAVPPVFVIDFITELLFIIFL